MSVGQFKANFSDILKQVKNGETIAVTFGKKKEIVGYFTPELPVQTKRKLGILEGKAKFTFGDNLKMTEEEFLGSK